MVFRARFTDEDKYVDRKDVSPVAKTMPATRHRPIRNLP